MPVTNHDFLLRCLPALCDCQTIEEEHLFIPKEYWRCLSTDSFGNRLVFGGLREEHNGFASFCHGIIQLHSYKIEDKQPSGLFGGNPGYQIPWKVIEDLNHFVYSNMHYCPGTSSVLTTPEAAWKSKKGVCQDFAQVLVMLCREEGIPARYVCGIMEGEGKTHAWAEIWHKGFWWGFDPTHDRQIDYGYMKIAHGRKAMDCSVNRGIYSGQGVESNYINTILQQL